MTLRAARYRYFELTGSVDGDHFLKVSLRPACFRRVCDVQLQYWDNEQKSKLIRCNRHNTNLLPPPSLQDAA